MGIVSTALGLGRDVLLLNERVDGLSQDVLDIRRDLRVYDQRLMRIEIQLESGQRRGRERRKDGD